MILLIDNYDSFTYMLRDYLHQIDLPCTVVMNDKVNETGVRKMNPEAIVFSPGPETPAQAGNIMPLINVFHTSIPMLGICLGHQAIGQFFGAELIHAEKPMHGKTSWIHASPHALLNGIPNPFRAMRYHSLLLQSLEHTPLRCLAVSEKNEIMMFVHPHYKICGIQFHPESVLTENGLQILQNWKRWFRSA